jgi:hypothetical protein
MTHARRHDEKVPRIQRYSIGALHLDAEAAVPAQEQFVLLVRVPREFAVKARYADHSIVYCDQVSGFPGAR